MLARAAGGCGGALPSILFPLPSLSLSPHSPPTHSSLTLAIPVCKWGYTCVYPKTRGRVLAKTNPRERKSGRGLRGLERSGKERICKGKPRDPVSVSEGRRSVSFLFRPRNGPPAQRINNEPDILIRGGKCSHASRKNVFLRSRKHVKMDLFLPIILFHDYS